MASNSKTIESAKHYLSTAASVAGSIILARTLVNEFLPSELRDLVSAAFDKLFARVSADHTIIIRQTEGLVSNELFDAVNTYLRTKISSTMPRLRASKNEDEDNIVFTLDDGEGLADEFAGVRYNWQLVSQQENSNGRFGETTVEARWFQLCFDKKHKETTLCSYFPHILERSKEIKASDRRLKLYMNQYDNWSSIDLNHPSTLDTLAMAAELKKTIIEDLARFVKRREYYKRIGKAWKRGYLLYGPPGTGKSSLVAAIANYLRFDIYDLDLKEVHNNADLKRLLIGMTNKSILVIEDIDCSIELRNRDDEKEEEKSSDGNDVTLSGILNFIDGLWSTSGEERIIVLTTNYKERLDPALLRPGRMDMHIHMGYCGPYGFQVLVSNYHGVDSHPLFEEIGGLLKEVEATPAEVAEELMRSEDVDDALSALTLFLINRKKKAEEDKGRADGCRDDKQKELDDKQIDAKSKTEESGIKTGDNEGDEAIIVGREEQER